MRPPCSCWAGDSRGNAPSQSNWDLDRLAPLRPNIAEELLALGKGTTPILERATEYAGYGVAICAVRALLPDERITHFNVGESPDLWLALAEDRGIEVAGRKSGRSAFEQAIQRKRADLKVKVSLKEAWISVWAFDLEQGVKERVR